MTSHPQMDPGPSTNSLFGWLSSRSGMATLLAIAILAFLLATGHSAHLLGALPYLLILACPLMHVFMHGQHGRHDNRDAASQSDQRHPNQE